MIEMFQPDFMQRAFLAALLVGITAPSVGIYLVQRRQALMGDGIGHVALTGVGLGFLFQANPIWMAVLVCVLGAIVMELVRARGNQRGDIALAMLFYGGMAGGKLLVSMSSQAGSGSLESYLWGSILTVSPGDLAVIGGLAAVVVAVTAGLRRQLFAVCQDEEFARVTGLPVRVLNLLLAVMAAVTVTVAMRVVGLLLVSALMVVPVAAAQQLTRSFAATQAAAVSVGVVTALLGVGTSYEADLPSGPTIVILAILTFALFSAIAAPLAKRRHRHRAAAEHGPAVCDVALPVQNPNAQNPNAQSLSAQGPSAGTLNADGKENAPDTTRATAGTAVKAPLSGETLSSRGLAQ
ncbi:metal ABC transporter permease [Kitasatospora sp. CB02891]|uniref:metal ABC transporter permease n=1 Tax=Kitasatospora sp. CB02891 TaxID=2020329 RepID=UPI000C278EF1|nr:metal ABC transporter permease [Kitasatospora sp. CB02891]PJN26826.1 ABC transporter [Kitasatospora sp. CB02891]